MIGIIETKTLSEPIVRCLFCVHEKSELDNAEPISLQEMLEDINNHGNVWR